MNKREILTELVEEACMPGGSLDYLTSDEKADLKRSVDSLYEDSDFLNALVGAGVDSWEGYDYAQEAMNAT